MPRQAVAAQALLLFGCGSGQQRSQLGGGGKQDGGLALDHAQVVLLAGVGVVQVQQLQYSPSAIALVVSASRRISGIEPVPTISWNERV